jgi:hypothetical protein
MNGGYPQSRLPLVAIIASFLVSLMITIPN